jgi:uncharacterized protein (TIGR02145 family)
MSENLRTTKYSNGENISDALGFEDFKVYDNDSLAIDEFGLYYNYSVVEDTSGICPCNWHVPTELDFTKLIEYAGGIWKALRKLKSSGVLEDGSASWINENPLYSGTNTIGFNALPAGFIFVENSLYKHELTFFWAITHESNKLLSYRIGQAKTVVKTLQPSGNNTDNYYYSIRCIKNL